MVQLVHVSSPERLFSWLHEKRQNMEFKAVAVSPGEAETVRERQMNVGIFLTVILTRKSGTEKQ